MGKRTAAEHRADKKRTDAQSEHSLYCLCLREQCLSLPLLLSLLAEVKEAAANSNGAHLWPITTNEVQFDTRLKIAT